MRRSGDDTPVTFSREEVHEIRKAVAAGKGAVCPHCGCALVVWILPERPATVDPVRQVRCNECHRAAFLRE